jgi:hypothetical protein
MATAAHNLAMQNGLIFGPFKMTVADSVDNLLYMPDVNGDLIVAAGNVLCGWVERQCKIGEHVSLVLTGVRPAKASGAITAGAAVTVDSAGKIKAATVGTDHVHGFALHTTDTDNDVVTFVKSS